MFSRSPRGSGSGSGRHHDGPRVPQPVPGRRPAQRRGPLRAAAPAPPAPLQPHRGRLPRRQAVRGRGSAGLRPATPRRGPVHQPPPRAGPRAAGRVPERDSAGGADRQQDKRGDRAIGHQARRPVWPGHHPHPQALPHQQPQRAGPVAPAHQQTLRPHRPGPTAAAPIKPLPPPHTSTTISPPAVPHPQRDAAATCPDRAAFIAGGKWGCAQGVPRTEGDAPCWGQLCLGVAHPPSSKNEGGGRTRGAQGSDSWLFPLSLALLGEKGLSSCCYGPLGLLPSPAGLSSR